MVIYKLFSVQGREIGIQTRFYEELSSNKYAKSKSQIYYHAEDALHAHFPKSDLAQSTFEGKPLYVIVEDVVSATRLSPYVTTIALLGTSVSAALTAFLVGANVVWALDGDATSTSIKYSKQLALVLNKSLVVPLAKDPKDMTPKEVVSNIINKIIF